MTRRLLTPEEYAASLPGKVSGRWIRYLCEDRRIPGATKLGDGERGPWAIPEGAKYQKRKVGRKKLKK